MFKFVEVGRVSFWAGVYRVDSVDIGKEKCHSFNELCRAQPLPEKSEGSGQLSVVP